MSLLSARLSLVNSLVGHAQSLEPWHAGNANLPIGDFHSAFRENGVPGPYSFHSEDQYLRTRCPMRGNGH